MLCLKYHKYIFFIQIIFMKGQYEGKTRKSQLLGFNYTILFIVQRGKLQEYFQTCSNKYVLIFLVHNQLIYQVVSYFNQCDQSFYIFNPAVSMPHSYSTTQISFQLFIRIWQKQSIYEIIIIMQINSKEAFSNL